MTSTSYHYIEIDAEGVAWISGSNTKVVELAAEQLAYGWDATKMRDEHPHLTLAQIHSALAYYYDHEAEVNRQIDQQISRADKIFASLPESAIRQKLRAARQRP
jgi:uncharacterized protein (DUF433 family)